LAIRRFAMANADLVLEGGGVKGTGLEGAITALTSAAEPYTFHRVAGTSAGAIVASMLAAGYTAAEMNTVMTELDFSQFEDNPGIFSRHFEHVGQGLGLIFHEGLFVGQFMHDWIKQILAAKNVHTWGDLKDWRPERSSSGNGTGPNGSRAITPPCRKRAEPGRKEGSWPHQAAPPRLRRTGQGPSPMR